MSCFFHQSEGWCKLGVRRALPCCAQGKQNLWNCRCSQHGLIPLFFVVGPLPELDDAVNAFGTVSLKFQVRDQDPSACPIRNRGGEVGLFAALGRMCFCKSVAWWLLGFCGRLWHPSCPAIRTLRCITVESQLNHSVFAPLFSWSKSERWHFSQVLDIRESNISDNGAAYFAWCLF
jgi:hypothetical protein